IITLSLSILVKEHKDNAELLLLISLLNSQDIPKDLMVSLKGNTILENLIYGLKKYSLIDVHPSTASFPTMLAIHRSTQEICLHYLKEELNLSKNDALLKNIVKTLSLYAIDLSEKGNVPQIKLLESHYVKLLRHCDLLSKAMKSTIEGELGYMY